MGRILMLSAAVAFALYMFACSATPAEDRYGNKNKSDSDAAATAVEMEESFDFSDFETEIDLPPVPDNISGGGTAKRPDVWYTYTDEEIPDSSAMNRALGYRVLVRTTDNLGTADSLRSELFFKTRDPAIYVDFEPPMFKVKIGDYREESSASDMKFQLNQLGFGNTVIITDSINVIR